MYSSPGYHDQAVRELWFSLLPSLKYNCIDGIKNEPSGERINAIAIAGVRARLDQVVTMEIVTAFIRRLQRYVIILVINITEVYLAQFHARTCIT
jgi:hypothetical protein